jgi:hypothetical protein
LAFRVQTLRGSLFPHAHGVGEDTVLPLIVQKLGNRKVVAILCAFAVRFDNAESVDALAFGIRERVQQYVIDDAEDRRGRTDSQPERGHTGEQKSMILAEAPQPEAQVLPERVHIGSALQITAQNDHRVYAGNTGADEPSVPILELDVSEPGRSG